MDEPPGFRWHVQARFGFAVAIPRRFHLLANTFDPVARSIRGVQDLSPGKEARWSGRWPQGLWDPEVFGELDDGRVQPFRLLEFESMGRDEPLPEDTAREMWFQARQMFTDTLESAELPGYTLLDVRDAGLGSLAALAFEYRWQGMRAGEDGGDHALLVWSLTPTLAVHVYHHCPENEWAGRRPELDEILGTFRLIDESDVAE